MDKNIFENGWNPENAYVFGWVMSDGCLTKTGRNKNTYTVIVNSNDGEIAEWMHNYMCDGNKVYKEGNSYSVRYRNDDGINFMISNGLHERKSYDVCFPNIPDEFLPHYVRGYFDGNGSVILHKNRYNTYCQVSITCGNRSYLECLQSLLIGRGIESKIYDDSRVGKSAYYLRVIKRSELEKFYQFLYADAKKESMLMRKKEKFDVYLACKPKYNV